MVFRNPDFRNLDYRSPDYRSPDYRNPGYRNLGFRRNLDLHSDRRQYLPHSNRHFSYVRANKGF